MGEKSLFRPDIYRRGPQIEPYTAKNFSDVAFCFASVDLLLIFVYMSLTILFACWLVIALTAGMYWMLQLMHYPLFTRVAPKEFNDYFAQYRKREPWIVHLPSVVSLILAIAILGFRPWSIPKNYIYILIATIGFNILLTFILVQPHLKILRHHGYSYPVIRRLTLTNWIRTLLWTICAIYLGGLITLLIDQQSL